MQSYKILRKDELYKFMEQCQDAFDLVRLVEPNEMKVISIVNGRERSHPYCSCFSVWGKDERCANCISLRSCTEKKRITKIEHIEGDSFMVISIPYMVIDNYGGQIVALELVNKITDDK